MMTLERQNLVIRFPEVHEDAVARISFQRTLRIPDDGHDYPLPPGMGEFPLLHVEDHHDRLPETWARRGGIFMPMYQSEALWMSFSSPGDYPIALQIAAGKINAVNGEPWQEDMQFDPQGYVVTTRQPWLDGFCIEKGRIRQFVAAPMGAGVTVEEQLTGAAEFGGIQIKAWPLKAQVYESLRRHEVDYCLSPTFEECATSVQAPMAMGLGMGGSMRQEIYEDDFEPDQWDTRFSSRCFVHLLNSAGYARVTGQLPPHRPFEAADYASAGLPWYHWYSDRASLDGGDRFKGLKTWKDFKQAYEDKLARGDITNIVGLGNRPGKGRPVSPGEGY